MMVPPAEAFGREPTSLPAVFAELTNDCWVGLEEAVRLIMRKRDIGPETALSHLRKACLTGIVRSRCIRALPDRKVIEIATLPASHWAQGSLINVDESSIWQFDLGEIKPISINETDLKLYFAKARKGPRRGSIARYAEDDRSLFPTISLIMRRDRKTVTEAVRELEF